MKTWLTFILVFLFTACTGEAMAVAGRKGHEPAVDAIGEKAEAYKAYIVTEGSTGRMLEGENVHAKRAPASVVKLMLACIVMEKVSRGALKVTDAITASAEATRIGGSQVYLKEGETFTLEEMMKAVLVASANDAAYAIAEHVAGTAEEFVRLMNEKAKTLGMVDTEFHSVHGLPPSKGEQEDLSSCSDLSILARELLKYPKVLEWTSLRSEGFRDGKFIMNNHNKLLARMAGVDGLKTGYYRETGYNIVVSAYRNDLRIIVVVMGSPRARTRDDFALVKLKKTFAQYRALPVVTKGEVIDRDVVLSDGKYRKIKGIAGTSFLYPIAADKKGTIKKEPVFPKKIKGEVKEGQKLGDLVITLDGEVIGKIDIVSPVYVPKANLFTRLIRKLGLSI
jgi:serine-type D-Ala-D-Ala carboxypeptidase (penicillin-binding protein 5/6)